MMNCCVLVKISARTVAFWYQNEGKRYTPLIMRGTHEVPLYFHVENNQFDFGTNARDRFYQHDPNAFGKYFELIKDPSRHFVLHNSPKRAKQLLYYGIEQFLSHFLNTVLYKSDSIESYRGELPLKFIFEPDLGEPERNLVSEMFTGAGYRKVSVISFNESLLQYLRDSGAMPKNQAALMLTGLNDVLYFELYPAGVRAAAGKAHLEGQGADPRISILAGMILDYIAEQNPYLDIDRSREVSTLLPFCATLLTSPKMILSGEAELTGGNRYWFSVKLKAVLDSLVYYPGDLLISTAVDDLLQAANLSGEQVCILLCSEQIKTDYFSERLLKRYPYVRHVNVAEAEEVMQYIVSQPSQTLAYLEEPVAPPSRPPVPPPRPGLPPAKPISSAIHPQAPLPVRPPMPAAKPVAVPVPVPVIPRAERPKTVLPPLPPPKKKN